jgi:hypothetical protein
MKFGTKRLNLERSRLMVVIAAAIFVFFLGQLFVAPQAMDLNLAN